MPQNLNLNLNFLGSGVLAVGRVQGISSTYRLTEIELSKTTLNLMLQSIITAAFIYKYNTLLTAIYYNVNVPYC